MHTAYISTWRFFKNTQEVQAALMVSPATCASLSLVFLKMATYLQVYIQRNSTMHFVHFYFFNNQCSFNSQDCQVQAAYMCITSPLV